MLTLEEIRKLPPEEKVKALHEFSEELKKRIEERQKEIEEAQTLLEEAENEMMVLEQVSVPKSREVSIEELFERGEEKSLEELTRQQASPDVIEAVAQRPVHEIYDRVNYLNETLGKETTQLTEDQRNEVYILERALQTKQKQARQGQYTPGQKAWQDMTAAEQILHQMQHGPEYQSSTYSRKNP